MAQSWFSDFFGAVEHGANALLGLVARSEQTIAKVQADHPYVSMAVKLAEKEVPGASQYAGIAEAILAAAQAGAAVIADTAQTVGAIKTGPAKAGAVTTEQLNDASAAAEHG